jgi:hypothetical protein
MPERSRNRKLDLSQLAKAIVDEATDQTKALQPDTRDPAAVSLGRRGGLVGGKARAAKLSPEQRSDIAKKAAAARWSQAKPQAE